MTEKRPNVAAFALLFNSLSKHTRRTCLASVTPDGQLWLTAPSVADALIAMTAAKRVAADITTPRPFLARIRRSAHLRIDPATGGFRLPNGDIVVTLTDN